VKTIVRISLLALLVFLFALPTLAQEATPESGFGALPPVTDITVEEGGSLTIDQTLPVDEAPEDPGLSAILALAASVFFAVELFKPTLDKWKLDYDWTDNLHQFAVRLLAAVAALVLIFSIPNDANIIAALGLTWQTAEWVAKVLTALAISGGATFIHALSRFFKLMPLATTVTASAVRRE
jgi:hypothetical protein